MEKLTVSKENPDMFWVVGGVATVVIFLVYFLVKQHESYANIDKNKEEQERLSDDSVAYEYNDYDFSQILDNQGNLLRTTTQLLQNDDISTKQDFSQHNREYIPPEYSELDSLSEHIQFNSNIDIPINKKLFKFSPKVPSQKPQAPIPEKTSGINKQFHAVKDVIVDDKINYSPLKVNFFTVNK